jgi:hypothetical protein
MAALGRPRLTSCEDSGYNRLESNMAHSQANATGGTIGALTSACHKASATAAEGQLRLQIGAAYNQMGGRSKMSLGVES